MPSSSLLALIDDIATVLDDVAVMTKIAAKKTAGVLGDDLALNAEQVMGIRASREIPVVWAVAKGSLKNKCILVPSALLISAFIPWLIIPLLMLGGTYLCYEGFEKIAHKLFHKRDVSEQRTEVLAALHNPDIDMVEFEQNKIRGAIRTDFILSAEIIVIALGTVKHSDFMTQVAVVTTIALFMTVGVYGFVAGIVKMDDAGIYLLKEKSNRLWGRCKRFVGQSLLSFAPVLMKTLSIVGTAAMFLVGGSILIHGLPGVGALIHAIEQVFVPESGFTVALFGIVLDGLFGLIWGALAVGVFSVITRIRSRFVQPD